MSTPWSTYLHHFGAVWRYYFRAQTRYDVHSPFLSHWLEAVIEDDREFYAFDEAEMIRHYWLYSTQTVDYSIDHGAGSRAGQARRRKVKDMVRSSAIDQETGRRLFRMVNYHQPKTILELGTNLGLSSLYIQGACPSARLITIEGHPEVAALAKSSFRRAKKQVPDIRIGTFGDELPKALAEMEQLDFVFIDGDHRYDSTIVYVEELLPKLHDRSILIIGDIHWSPGMEQAWEELCRHPRVTMSVDLFHIGVLFFRPEQQEIEHFTLIPYRFKPWRLGFF